MQPTHQGSCLCGAIHYQLSAPLKALSHCHCTQCQKAHGAAFASYASVARSTLLIDRGEHLLATYRSSPTVARQFCSQCGSTLFWSNSGGQFADWVSVAVATLDTPLEAHKAKHLWVESRPQWHHTTGLAQQP
ncbi:S-(hydroxymethyl)glutathione synthase [Pseudomonas sp. StFLB209]|uniref:GFA family protein n=1 Tax=Pseudomonas sp. StFLB209 TaxID=1028989 RepID=UPI0004F70F2D|nr:GFA family protein [Pseudomonas sp. StFLB209]BAP43754.1 S-(hydroxymethyl)glutathione synthase [Pseudomonas sp. StFLB209]